jgi:hypothetical protein
MSRFRLRWSAGRARNIEARPALAPILITHPHQVMLHCCDGRERPSPRLYSALIGGLSSIQEKRNTKKRVEGRRTRILHAAFAATPAAPASISATFAICCGSGHGERIKCQHFFEAERFDYLKGFQVSFDESTINLQSIFKRSGD